MRNDQCITIQQARGLLWYSSRHLAVYAEPVEVNPNSPEVPIWETRPPWEPVTPVKRPSRK